KCNFNFDIVVGEDCSSDNSREILINYQKNHPGKFKLLLHKTNIGANKNQEQVLDNCTGRYIAICEGDDYWTDPHKLQKQVDFLENNPDYSICFHNVEEVDSNGKVLDIRHVISDSVEKTYTIEDLAEGNFIHTASVLFRRNFNELPSWFFTSPAGDYPLHIMNASYGLIKYFPEKMAAYRIGQGVWSSQTRQVQFVNTIFVIKLMMANLKLSNQVLKNFDNQISRLLLHIKDVVSPNIPQQSPENIAYNLSLKKLIIILLKKIRYSF
ncbi:MAG: glycosyltransferase, partial [Chryseobacterium sp.]